MILRRVLAAGAAAAVVLGLGMAGSAAPARASTVPSHVAIVVGLKEGTRTACVPWHSGMSGIDVLDRNRGGAFSILTNTSGLVVQIEGEGDLQARTAYWSYWNNAGAGWGYSSAGEYAYHPAPGTVDGWAYGTYDGKVVPSALQGQTYAAICAGQDPQYVPASPAPAPVPRSSAAAATSAARASGTSAPGTSATGTATGTDASTGTAGAAGRSAPRAGFSRPAATGHATTASGSGASVPSPSPASTPASTRTEASDASGSPAAVSIAALLAVVALGGGAFWRMRRQRLS